MGAGRFEDSGSLSKLRIIEETNQDAVQRNKRQKLLTLNTSHTASTTADSCRHSGDSATAPSSGQHDSSTHSAGCWGAPAPAPPGPPANRPGGNSSRRTIDAISLISCESVSSS